MKKKAVSSAGSKSGNSATVTNTVNTMAASKEARIIRIKQMSGTAVSMALKPSRGVRDDIVFAGGKPKDHNKENYLKLKEMQKKNKMLEEDKSKPAPPPFRLKQFENVPSRLSTRRNSSLSLTSSSDDHTYIDSADPSRSTSPGSTRPSTASSTTSSTKNFIRINAAKIREASLKKSASTPDLSEARSSPRIPKGMRLLDEQERVESLEFLKQNREDLLAELSKFGLVVESSTLKKKKNALENRLTEIEDAIEVYSRKRVYVKDDDFEREQEGQ
ncbi:hypothetical protein HDU76_004405 [Blyttiomyces sp. JEL0837]|nr:hypothetical protein HDU76_004405 [Blyttiomyces sp. JEL0837]